MRDFDEERPVPRPAEGEGCSPRRDRPVCARAVKGDCIGHWSMPHYTHVDAGVYYTGAFGYDYCSACWYQIQTANPELRGELATSQATVAEAMGAAQAKTEAQMGKREAWHVCAVVG